MPLNPLEFNFWVKCGDFTVTSPQMMLRTVDHPQKYQRFHFRIRDLFAQINAPDGSITIVFRSLTCQWLPILILQPLMIKHDQT